MLPKFPEEDGEFRMTEAQQKVFQEKMDYVWREGWGEVKVKFKNHQLVFIEGGAVKMVGSRTYDEY